MDPITGFAEKELLEQDQIGGESLDARYSMRHFLGGLGLCEIDLFAEKPGNVSDKPRYEFWKRSFVGLSHSCGPHCWRGWWKPPETG